MRQYHPSALIRNRRGIAATEFAIIAPVLFLMLFGVAEAAYQFYMRAVLTGAVQDAGRESSLPGNNTDAAAATIDGQVLSTVRAVNTHATIVPTRQSFQKFTSARGEPFVDTAGTGVYDSTKDCFYDLNGNKVWDSTDTSGTNPGAGGDDDQGNADDVVLYTVSVTYPRLFPLLKGMPWSDPATVTASTFFKNQPYTDPAPWPGTQVCPTAPSTP